MKYFYRTFALVLLAFALNPPTYAQAKNQLKIEVVVFQTGAVRGWTEERWPELYDQQYINQNQLLRQYRLLNSNQLDLTQQVARMTPKKGYIILAHFGWTQPAYNKRQAKYLPIDTSFQKNPNYPSSIFGSIRAYKERFNHAEVHINLDRPIPNSIKERFAENQQLDKDYLPRTWRFRIDESRRVKAGELHYIDHPLFGVLVKVTSI